MSKTYSKGNLKKKRGLKLLIALLVILLIIGLFLLFFVVLKKEVNIGKISDVA